MDNTVDTLLNSFGAAGVLIAAIYLVSNKLAKQYEDRIAALEKASQVCEQDRVNLRNLIIEQLIAKKEA